VGDCIVFSIVAVNWHSPIGIFGTATLQGTIAALVVTSMAWLSHDAISSKLII